MAALELAFDIIGRDKGATRSLREVGDEADKTGRKVGDAGDSGGRLAKGIGNGAKLAAVGLAGLGIAAGALATGFIREAAESAKIGRLTDAVIKSTGGSAKVTAAQVGDLAQAISNKTAMDDEAIQSGANLMLTFTKVRNEVGKGNDIFDQATQAAVDMSVAMGSDVSAASLQLGKALNDPIKGMTALAKSGVSFTQQQKDQVKAMVAAGDTLGAQKIILAEMQVQFGGAAAAAADPMARLQVIAGNLGESIGGLLLPYVERFATFVADKVVPTVENFITGMSDGTGAGGDFADRLGMLKDRAVEAFDYFKTDILPRLTEFAVYVRDEVLPKVREFGGFLKDNILPVLEDIAQFIIDNKDWFGPFIISAYVLTAALSAATTAQVLLNGAMLANPVGAVIILIAAMAATVYTLWQRSETYRGTITALWIIMKNGAREVGQLFLDMASNILGALEGVFTVLGKIPGPIGATFRGAAAEVDKVQRGVDVLNRSLDEVARVRTVKIDAGEVGRTAAAANALSRDRRAVGDGPGAGGPMLTRVSSMIAGTGMSVTSTYRTPARNAAVGGSPSSYHLDRSNPAVDIVGPPAALDRLAATLRAQGGLRELLWRTAGHYDHLHVADQGGIFQGPGMVYMGAGQETFASGLAAKKVADLPAGGGPMRLHPADIEAVGAVILRGVTALALESANAVARTGQQGRSVLA